MSATKEMERSIHLWEPPTVQNRQLPPCSESRQYLYATDCETSTQALPKQR
jgi:hypothetical protein